jgi:hypothetical protein
MQKQLLILVSKEMYQQIHNLMEYSVKAEEGLDLYKTHEGSTKQSWYRELLRAGIVAKRQEFERKKREIESL